MINQSEAMELVEVLNRARKALGQYVDNTNDFAITADFNEFLTIGKQFQDFGKEEMKTAITNAFYKKREVQAQAGVNPDKVHLNPSDVKAQCHAILQAKRATEQANAPKLEAPKPVQLEGEEWLDAYFRQGWENAKAYGFHLLPRLWNSQTFQTLSQMKALNARLVKIGLSEGRKENARRMTLDEFHRDLNGEMKAAGFNEAYTFTRTDDDYHTKEGREAINERINRHNSSKPTKVDWDANEAYNRARCIAAVRTYGYLMEELNWKLETTTI